LQPEKTLALGTMALLMSCYQSIVWNWLGVHWWGQPFRLAGLALGTVPINALGVVLDKVPFRHDFTRGITGFANFLIVARKPG
jgi:hypothetical protein